MRDRIPVSQRLVTAPARHSNARRIDRGCPVPLQVSHVWPETRFSCFFVVSEHSTCKIVFFLTKSGPRKLKSATFGCDSAWVPRFRPFGVQWRPNLRFSLLRSGHVLKNSKMLGNSSKNESLVRHSGKCWETPRKTRVWCDIL